MGDLLHAQGEKFLQKAEHRDLRALAEYVMLSRALIRVSGITRHCAETYARREGEARFDINIVNDYHVQAHITALHVEDVIERAMDATINGDPKHHHRLDITYPILLEIYASILRNVEEFERHREYEQSDGFSGRYSERAESGSIFCMQFGSLTFEETKGARYAMNDCLAAISRELQLSWHYNPTGA